MVLALFQSGRGLQGLCVHVPRAGNMVADFLVKVLNERRNCKVLCPGFARLVQNGYVKLVLYTDGGSRGNPGLSAAAACLCIVQDVGVLPGLASGSGPASSGLPLNFIFANSVLENRSSSLHIVACSAVQLGVATAPVAELEAACLGRRLVVEWLRSSSLL